MDDMFFGLPLPPSASHITFPPSPLPPLRPHKLQSEHTPIYDILEIAPELRQLILLLEFKIVLGFEGNFKFCIAGVFLCADEPSINFETVVYDFV